jgi:hypothetical protein
MIGAYEANLPGYYSGGHCTVVQGLAQEGPFSIYNTTALSNVGEVVGDAQAPGCSTVQPDFQNDEPMYAVRYTQGKPVILGIVPGVVPITVNDTDKLVAAYVTYYPTAVNDFGDVVGRRYAFMDDAG